ncbi:hypothetical protein CVD28_01930 [Bacillus sp. M6-12]|uniref:hypothetical protein n=1 Tax=Bacillus sp. M6-12 TaxID=2054166 RepID=UPI000C77BE46|nr:hypothetical protein [Bacillus sp. M6-12]PLS19191.1 hypothetical protein CVD28_01930 [Bacillus sp. M6-12]
MENIVLDLYTQVLQVLGSGEELIDECEATTCYTIASLYKQYRDNLYKVEGTFNGNGHFWCELNGEIIDLSVEQFDVDFQYLLTKERKHLYVSNNKKQVNQEIIEDSIHIAEISGFYIE